MPGAKTSKKGNASIASLKQRHTHTHIVTHTHIYTHIYTHMYTHAHAFTHYRIHKRTHPHAQAHTHTHTDTVTNSIEFEMFCDLYYLLDADHILCLDVTMNHLEILIAIFNSILLTFNIQYSIFTINNYFQITIQFTVDMHKNNSLLPILFNLKLPIF